MDKAFAHFGADVLMNMGLGEAICRVGSRDADFNLRTDRLAHPVDAAQRRDAIRRLSRERWVVSLVKQQAPPDA